MSRSRRKPYWIVPRKSNYKGYIKRLYNKKLRRLPLSEDFSNMRFRKYNCSWDIKDYVYYSPEDKKAYRK